MHRLTEQKRQALDLLCRAGVGLAPIAPDVCRLVREMVGAEACGLFWLDAQGQPEGFFHEFSLPAVQEFFLNEYQRLFTGPGEVNVSTLARDGGATVGHLLAPPSSYYRSNTFNLLVRASGHHHSLDLRVDVAGRARAVVLLFREAAQPFGLRDVALLQRVEPYLQRAVINEMADVDAASANQRTGHLLLDETGQQLFMLSGDAQVLLQRCTLVGQDVRLTASMQVVPRFLRELCQSLSASGQSTERRVLDIPGGWLVLTAHRLQAAQMEPAHLARPVQILVTLAQMTPPRLQVVQRVLALNLSPLQREIALLAGAGGVRADCERRMGVSREALKQHLKTIYRVAGVSGWEALTTALKSAPVVV